MNRRLRNQLIVVTLLAFATPTWLGAEGHRRKQPHYKLVELGTFGGPHSYGSPNGDGGRVLNDSGSVSSYADLADPDPNAPDSCFDADCLIAHAFRWKNGVLTDLGALADSSAAGGINDWGWSTGQSQTGIFDTALGFPEIRAVLWKRHEIVNLGTLEGGSESLGIYVNDTQQVVGISDNGVSDPFSLFGLGVQMRTFLWDRGALRDIGTLGGPDAITGPGCNNQLKGFIVGQSYTDFTPNDSTGIPTLRPFLWLRGRMIDLGSLGGTLGSAQCANNRGEIIGTSTLPGDLKNHAFFWRRGIMKDLGTLGGDNSEAIWMNDAGEIAGSADLAGVNLHDAVRWKNGKILDLGTVAGDACSRGRAINSRGQVVGGSSDCSNFLHAFVWEEGGPMLDLNTLIPPDSGLQLTNAININDAGEILAKAVPLGVTPIDDEDLGRVVLLIPCEAHHGGDCDTNSRNPNLFQQSPAAARTSVAAMTAPRHPQTAKEAAEMWRARMARQYRIPAIAPHR